MNSVNDTPNASIPRWISYPVGFLVYLAAVAETYDFVQGTIMLFKFSPVFMAAMTVLGIIPFTAGIPIYIAWLGNTYTLYWALENPKSYWELWGKYVIGIFGTLAVPFVWYLFYVSWL